MTVIATDVEYRYSGGAANTSAAASLGGAMGTAAGATIDDNVLNDLFDDVSSAEQAAGDVEYRGIYIGLKAAAGSGGFADARVYHSADDANAGDIIDVAIAAEAMNANMATIANESTAPAAVTFTHPTTFAGGLQLNGATGYVASDERGVWIRRTITAGAASGLITNTLAVEGTVI